MKPYLLLITLTALMIAGATWLPDPDLTRIETGPAATFTLISPLPVEVRDDQITVKMSVSQCGKQPHSGSPARIGRWQS